MLPDAYSPLRNRNYAIFFAVQTLSLMGSWATHTALAYVALQQTGGAATLGVLIATFAVPMVLASPFAGAIVDRSNRRRLYMAGCITAALISATAALLVGTNVLQQWHVFALYIALGVMYAFNQPTADAITADLNQGAEMRKAATLNQIAGALGRTVGSVVAGFLVQAFGAAWAFWFDALSFLPVVLAMLLLTSIPHVHKSSARSSLLREYAEGFSYVRSSPRLFDILLCVFVACVFGFVGLTLYPAFVQITLQGSGSDLGLFQGAVGFGGLLGTFLLLPRLVGIQRSGALILSLVGGGGTGLAAIGLFAHSLLPAAALAVASAATGYCNGAIAFGLLGSLAEPAKRGRVFSLFQIAIIGSQIPGALLGGALANWVGPAIALAIHGCSLVAFAILMFAVRPAFAAWRHTPATAAA